MALLMALGAVNPSTRPLTVNAKLLGAGGRALRTSGGRCDRSATTPIADTTTASPPRPRRSRPRRQI